MPTPTMGADFIFSKEDILADMSLKPTTLVMTPECYAQLKRHPIVRQLYERRVFT